MADIMERVLALCKAQEDAELRGEKEFVCPCCGGQAKWQRAENGHRHIGCCGCGLKVME